MGYYATGSGVLTLKDSTKIKSISDKLDETFDTFSGTEEIEITFNGSYHEDDLYELLNSIASEVETCTLYFVGEGDNHWKIVFESSSQTWKEYQGKIVYEDGEGEY